MSSDYYGAIAGELADTGSEQGCGWARDGWQCPTCFGCLDCCECTPEEQGESTP